MKHGRIGSYSTSLDEYRISKPNIAPASGAWKSAAMPADTPAVMRIRRARRLKENQDATRLPQDAPRSVTGPSYPAEPPDATVRTDAVDLTGITAGGT